MSKTGWIILIVCLCVVLCICIGIRLARRVADSLFFGGSDTKVDDSSTRDYKDLNNPFSADGVYSVRMEELKKLNIDWISGSVTIELTDADTVRIQEVSEKAIPEKHALRYGVNGGTLRIQACKKGYIGKLPEKQLKVSLPRALAERLRECEIDTVSAAVSTGDLKLDELEIDTVSGRVELRNMAAGSAELDTVSGQIELSDCAMDTLRIDSVSAFVHAAGTVRKLKASSVSGEVQLHLETCRELKINTTSGRIVLDLGTTPEDLSIDTTSGRTLLTLPRDTACAIRLDTMSGKLYLNEAAVSGKELVLGDGSAAFDIDSVSGSVYVYTK